MLSILENMPLNALLKSNLVSLNLDTDMYSTDSQWIDALRE